MADHSIRVVTLLTGDEYLAMQSMADSDGLSDSAFMRRLLKLGSPASGHGESIGQSRG